MPINLAERAGFLGSVPATTGASTSNFDGSFLNPNNVTGSINAMLQADTSNIQGLFDVAPDRTGTVTVTLNALNAAFREASSLIYDVTLGGTRTINTLYTYPTLPATTSTVTANPGNFASLLNNGTRLNLAPGTYSFPTVPNGQTLDDVYINATTPGTVDFAGEVILRNINRMVLDGLNTTQKIAIEDFQGGVAPTDILINNHYGLQTTATELFVPQGGYQRIMIQNSTFINDQGGFALIGGNMGDGNVGFIMANNWWWFRTSTTGPTMVRLMECDQILMVDEYWEDTRLRIHKNMDQVTIADCIGTSSGGGFFFITDNIPPDPNGTMENVYFERNDIYDDVSSFSGENLWSALVGVGGTQINPAYAIDNRMYFHLQASGSDTMSPNVNSTGFAAGAYTNNLRVPYQTPPARSTQGATGVGRP